MNYQNLYAGKLTVKILEVLRVARPETRRAAREKEGHTCGNAGAGNEAALRQAQHNGEATAMISAVRLIR